MALTFRMSPSHRRGPSPMFAPLRGTSARGLLRKISYKFNEFINAERFAPDPRRDTFLVTYPRSGTTWISCIAAQLMFKTSPPSLHAATCYVPDIHDLPVRSQVPEAPRYLVKSHLPRHEDLPSMQYRRVIYLIRDPRDALLSYHRYVTARYDYQNDFCSFVTDALWGHIWPGSWHEHVNSWLAPHDKPAAVEVTCLRYEDFVRDPFAATAKLAELLDLRVSGRQIEEAVSATTPEMMRQKEACDPMFPGSPIKFIGSATPGDWKRHATGAAGKAFTLIEKSAGPTMVRFGYHIADGGRESTETGRWEPRQWVPAAGKHGIAVAGDDD